MSTIKTLVPVGVIIPCYRCALTIRRAVGSVFAQSVIPAEIILVEDCSGDETLVALQELEEIYPGQVKIIQMQSNQGAASARNAGWAVATQPYIAFLDSDDSWHPDKLRIQFGYMSENPNVALSGHQCALFQSSIMEMKVPKNWNIKNISARSLLFRNSFSTPTVMLKSDVSLRFQEGKRCAEDLLLWQEIAFLGLKVVRIETILAYVHKPLYGASGLSAQLWEMEKGELKNFVSLRESSSIGLFIFVIATFFSFIKFIKRFILVKIIGFKKKYTRESIFL